MAQFTFAPEVEAIAAKMIADEPEFEDLQNETIVYSWRDKSAVKGGKPTAGTAEVIRGKAALLYHKRHSSPFFMMNVGKDSWELLETAGREWLVRHLLRHFDLSEKKNGQKKFSKREADIALFFADLKDNSVAVVCRVLDIVKEQYQLKLVFDGSAGDVSRETHKCESCEATNDTVKYRETADVDLCDDCAVRLGYLVGEPNKREAETPAPKRGRPRKEAAS